MNPPPPEAEGGVIRQVRQFAAVFGEYVTARLRLMRLEGREAGAHLLKVFLLIAATIAFAFVAWLFLCLGLVALLAESFTAHGWLWGSLIMAGAHLAFVYLLTRALKQKVRTPVFPLTTEELKKDQEWLETEKQANRS